jgi:hypothetical protein
MRLLYQKGRSMQRAWTYKYSETAIGHDRTGEIIHETIT